VAGRGEDLVGGEHTGDLGDQVAHRS
jgi:hypothetical protein